VVLLSSGAICRTTRQKNQRLVAELVSEFHAAPAGAIVVTPTGRLDR
jgi:hypothetical protein